MKILAFVDVHGSLSALRKIAKKSKSADILICAGDISTFESDLPVLLGKLSKIGKPVLILQGNHETIEKLQFGCENLRNVEFFHKKARIIEDTLFIGYGGGGFQEKTPRMEVFFRKQEKLFEKAKRKIFITHAPPYNTRLDEINRNHSGNYTQRNLIIKYQPDFAICGHFHENWQKSDILGNTKIINPGPYGRIIKL